MSDVAKTTKKLAEIFSLFPPITAVQASTDSVKILQRDGVSLVDISPTKIEIPGLNITDRLFEKPSPLPDSFVPLDQIQNLLNHLSFNNLFQRLNHIGICYQIESIKKEKQRLANEIKKSGWHLYEEISSDESTWLFVGDKSNWENPLVELVIVEHSNDKWKDYWLPHFQIDIDTYMLGEEIEKLILDSFKEKVKPFRIIETDKYVVLVRARLGCVSGINIDFDMGFEGRMTRYHRTKLLKELS